MYKVFDGFLETDTWFKDHPNDNNRFYAALSEVIDKENFSPDTMAEYIINYKRVDVDNEDDQYFVKRIRDLQSAAWHISDYKNFVSNI